MILVSFILLIRGIFKKKRTLWVSSLISGIFFILLIVFSITSYISDEINYWGSEKHRKESFEKAKNIGKSLGGQITGITEGIIESVDQDAIIKLAGKSGEIIGKGTTAIEEGFNGFKKELKILTEKSLVTNGLSIGNAQILKKNKTYSIAIFIEYNQNFENSLVLTTYDNSGKSINNSISKIKHMKGDGKLELFLFKIFDPTKISYCILKVKN